MSDYKYEMRMIAEEMVERVFMHFPKSSRIGCFEGPQKSGLRSCEGRRMEGRRGKMEQIICTPCNGKGFTEEDGYTRTCRVCDGDPVITFETVKEYAFQIDDLRLKCRVLEEKLSAEKEIAARRAEEIKFLKDEKLLKKDVG